MARAPLEMELGVSFEDPQGAAHEPGHAIGVAARPPPVHQVAHGEDGGQPAPQ